LQAPRGREYTPSSATATDAPDATWTDAHSKILALLRQTFQVQWEETRRTTVTPECRSACPRSCKQARPAGDFLTALLLGSLAMRVAGGPVSDPAISNRPQDDTWIMRALVVYLFFAISASGCGGKTERSSDRAGTSRDGGADGGWPSTPLGQCIPGQPRASAPTCPFIADGYCYPDKLAACNCICPADRDSWCVSGLEPPGVPASVSCI
jgi:hypothetical protein